ncbi:hypothetical protein DICSQDRAFT_173966 [Dichomitus squalens LYAD-421 SS1]|uniref:Uncharacterized protein n=1 Tax=Dichomitus squalens (strain LYAD-421) TaxID=732165 RepID=R7SNV5_DICSQ|nr:uncharacterized protein DICSQDRAFT_173966 [Dichomitus squalens LYAD-421 SS1]EJF57415.1 hypothetical protein DICSQDRAFT_173966 [Dichomitus squalens LYAD-421 SS1]
MLESIIEPHVWLDVHMLHIDGCIAKISALARTFSNLCHLTFHIEFSVKQEMGFQNNLKTPPLMEKTKPLVLSVTLSHTVLEVFLGRMKSSMLLLRSMEMVVNNRACGRASMQW